LTHILTHILRITWHGHFFANNVKPRVTYTETYDTIFYTVQKRGDYFKPKGIKICWSSLWVRFTGDANSPTDFTCIQWHLPDLFLLRSGIKKSIFLTLLL